MYETKQFYLKLCILNILFNHLISMPKLFFFLQIKILSLISKTLSNTLSDFASVRKFFSYFFLFRKLQSINILD